LPTVFAGNDAVVIVGTALIVSVYVAAAVAPLASVTVIVMPVAAAAVGVPASTPPVVSVSPAGSAVLVHTYAVVPPLAVRVTEYGRLIVQAFGAALVIAGAVATTSVRLLVTVAPAASVSV